MILKPLMRPDLPTGTVTFLFTDVEGSTRLLEEIGDEAYEEALSVHRRIVRAACQTHDGVEVDTQGDAFFFAFPEPSGALAAAQQMIEGLVAGPIRVRVGLHTGTPRLGEEGYVGSDVHFGARVAACAHGGQVVLSQATRDLVDGCELTDLGEHRLKDIENAVAIFQLGDESFPPLKTISNTNLPRPASSFVGREQELEAVNALIKTGARLVTLTGPGGSGKTRLALETASALVPEYKAGVFWIGLSALRDPALVTETIAQTLGAKEGLAEHIGEREMLLLLDNLEQVIEAAPQFSSLLQACSNLTLLVTSRELLRVQGEVEYAVPPLASPEAVSLFCERSRLEPSEEIAELCARLDNLPLAVELAAARAKALTPAQILDRLSSRLDLLKGGRDADPRQQTLRATIAWSYDLLHDEEKRLFRSLSVFSGGCTLEAAEEVAGADLDTMQSLVERSLVRFSNGRYWMLETIVEYSVQCLEASGEAANLRTTHAVHYATLSQVVDAHLREAHHTRWLDQLEAELGNVRAALEHFRVTADTRSELRLAASLARFWRLRGHLTEGRRCLDRALRVAPTDLIEVRMRALRGAAQLARLQGDYKEARSNAEQALELARVSRDPITTGDALHTLALIAIDDEEDLDSASRLLEEATEAFRFADDDRALAITTSTRGYIALVRGEHAEALVFYEQSLAVGRAIGSDEVIALAFLNVGAASLGAGRVDDAFTAFVQGLRLSTELRSLDWISYAHEGLAAVYVAQGKMERGLQLAASAEAIRTELGTSLDPVEQRIHESTLDALRDAVPQQVIGDAFKAARKQTFEKALVLAPDHLD